MECTWHTYCEKKLTEIAYRACASLLSIQVDYTPQHRRSMQLFVALDDLVKKGHVTCTHYHHNSPLVAYQYADDLSIPNMQTYIDRNTMQ